MQSYINLPVYLLLPPTRMHSYTYRGNIRCSSSHYQSIFINEPVFSNIHIRKENQKEEQFFSLTSPKQYGVSVADGLKWCTSLD